MTHNDKFVYNPDLAGGPGGPYRALVEESDDSTSLSDVAETMFGDGQTGKKLLADVRDATHHVNATLKKLNDGLGKYAQAFKTTGDAATQTDAQIAADTKLLADGTAAINTPFYKNKHGKPDAPPPPLLPWGYNHQHPEMI